MKQNNFNAETACNEKSYNRKMGLSILIRIIVSAASLFGTIDKDLNIINYFY